MARPVQFSTTERELMREVALEIISENSLESISEFKNDHWVELWMRWKKKNKDKLRKSNPYALFTQFSRGNITGFPKTSLEKPATMYGSCKRPTHERMEFEKIFENSMFSHFSEALGSRKYSHLMASPIRYLSAGHQQCMKTAVNFAPCPSTETLDLELSDEFVLDILNTIFSIGGTDTKH